MLFMSFTLHVQLHLTKSFMFNSFLIKSIYMLSTMFLIDYLPNISKLKIACFYPNTLKLLAVEYDDPK